MYIKSADLELLEEPQVQLKGSFDVDDHSLLPTPDPFHTLPFMGVLG